MSDATKRDADKIRSEVRALDAANRAMYDAQEAYCNARAAVVKAAIEAGITSRCVIVVGKTGWYIDPPGTHHGTHADGWGGNVGWRSVFH
jgi:hypothetical protein